MTCTVLLHCPINAKIRTADSQSDFRIVLYLRLKKKKLEREENDKNVRFNERKQCHRDYKLRVQVQTLPKTLNESVLCDRVFKLKNLQKTI